MVVTLAVAVPAAAPAHADPRDDARRARADVAQVGAVLEDATARARAAAMRYAKAAAALPGAQTRVAEAKGKVAAARVAVNSARRVADAAKQEYAAAQARFETAQGRVERAREQFAEVVSADYKGGNLATVNVLMSASGPMDALNRFGYVGSVMQRQQDTIQELAAARRQATAAQDAATAAKRRAERARHAAERALAGAQDAQAAAEAAQAEVVGLALERRGALAEARSERAATLAKYREAKAEEARIQAELRAWEDRQRRRGPVLRPGAAFLMPVRGWKSSDYGMRLNPYYGIWRMHTGVDFAAAGGQPIHAVADGRVIRAGWSGGYGMFTCISHGRRDGRGVTSCYAHQSRINVSSGQWVRRGQVIGRVGTTGASTGAHLHFEVRLDGSPTNPLRWLPGCLC